MFIPTLFQAGELQYFIQIIRIIEWQPVRSLLLNAHRERERVKMKKLWSTSVAKIICWAPRGWRRVGVAALQELFQNFMKSFDQEAGANCLSNGWLLALLAIFFLCQSPETGNCVLNILQSFNPNHRKSYQVNDFYASIWDLWGLQAYRWISASLRGQITNGPIFFFGRSWKVQTRTLSSSWRTWWRPLGAQEPW